MIRLTLTLISNPERYSYRTPDPNLERPTDPPPLPVDGTRWTTTTRWHDDGDNGDEDDKSGLCVSDTHMHMYLGVGGSDETGGPPLRMSVSHTRTVRDRGEVR